MPRTPLVLVIALIVAGASHAADRSSEVRVLLDPNLTASASSRPPDRDERAALIGEARMCLAELRSLLVRTSTRAHFQQHYGLNPVRVLERDDFAVIVRPFVKPRSPETIQVGGYVFGETTLDLNVSVLRAARAAVDPRPWRRYVAGLLVHELAHLADYLDDGVNDDGGLLEGEEGEAAQKASGCELAPPGELHDEGPTITVNQEFWSPRRR